MLKSSWSAFFFFTVYVHLVYFCFCLFVCYQCLCFPDFTSINTLHETDHIHRSALVTHLNPGCGYHFRVTAVNQFGPGPPSLPSGSCRRRCDLQYHHHQHDHQHHQQHHIIITIIIIIFFFLFLFITIIIIFLRRLDMSMCVERAR
jgi:hypothetical protein